MVGSKKDNPAWLYLGFDLNRMSDEQHKLLKRARNKSLSIEEVYESLQTEGLFGVLSGEDTGCDEILLAYYMRQAAEQIFDIAKTTRNSFRCGSGQRKLSGDISCFPSWHPALLR